MDSKDKMTDSITGKLPGERSSSGPDKEMLLIAALMYLLIKEGGDMKLILALAYILL